MSDYKQSIFTGDEMGSSEGRRGHTPVNVFNPQGSFAPQQPGSSDVSSLYHVPWDTGDVNDYQLASAQQQNAMFLPMAGIENFGPESVNSSYASSGYLSHDPFSDWMVDDSPHDGRHSVGSSGTRTGSVSTAHTSTDSPLTEFSYPGGPSSTSEGNASFDCVHDMAPSMPSPVEFAPFGNDLVLPAHTPVDLFHQQPVVHQPAKHAFGEEHFEPPKRIRSQGHKASSFSGPTTRSRDAQKPQESRRCSMQTLTRTTNGVVKAQAPVSDPAVSYVTPGSGSRAARHRAAQLRTAFRKPKQQQQQQQQQQLDRVNRRGADVKHPGAGTGTHETNVAVGEDDELTPDERRARNSHNLVEKQYRTRLNKQFEELLAVLSDDSTRTDGSGLERVLVGEKHGVRGNGKGQGPPVRAAASTANASAVTTSVAVAVAAEVSAAVDHDKRLSKAEVLELARKEILRLRKERETYKSQYLELSALANVVAHHKVTET